MSLIGLPKNINAKLETGEILTFATFGDSITWPCFHTDFRQNYITLTLDALCKVYPKANVRIVHAGNLGSLGRGLGNGRFDRLVLKEGPDVVFIMFGMNDCGGGPGGLDEYDRNLTITINKTKELGALPVVLTQNEIIYKDSGGRDALPQFMDRAVLVAKRERVPCADCFSLWQSIKSDPEKLAPYLNDAIHPNLAGHRLFAKTILQTLWPGAAQHIPAVPRMPMRLEDGECVDCLLPGPRGKQVVRTKDGTWFVIWGRMRAHHRLADLVVSFSQIDEPTWDDFQHLPLIGPEEDSVFDDHDRVLTAGMLLEADDRLWVVFSWNVGVFVVSLDRGRGVDFHHIGDVATWMEHSIKPYPRPSPVYSMDQDGNVLYDAYLTADGWPAVFSRYFQMGPGAGYEVVAGESGVGHVISRPDEQAGPREFLFPLAHAIRCTQTLEGEVHYFLQQESGGRWKMGSLGLAEFIDVPDGKLVCEVPPVSADPQSFISNHPGPPNTVPLSWSDGQRDGIIWQTVPRGNVSTLTYAYQARWNGNDKGLGMVTNKNGKLGFMVVELNKR